MKRISLTEEWVQGAVSVERRENGLKPWRIPYDDYELYPPEGIGGKAEITAGVRLRFCTDSRCVVLCFEPISQTARIDCSVNGELAEAGTAEVEAGSTTAQWQLAAGEKELELWLPQNTGMILTALLINTEASASPLRDERPRWIAYGSSITQCVAAESPSRTWPAIAAAAAGFHLTCLGYSGNCQMEPMVSRLIRDTPADLITLCLGINVYGAATLSARTFKPAVIGMVATIREQHRDAPLLLLSPIYSSERETTPNKLDLTVGMIREQIEEIVDTMRSRGDRNLHYRNGLIWFGEADASMLPDGLHPDAAGCKLMGDRFAERVLAGVRWGR
ncbi:GDSL family lipase [Cohnella sp. LGH]|uniref:SGNH/GDSL hydrolase family protein n=1 Tax=Cohnella sp. LGH TaxID=1619153 RepID=UPI001ADA826B|nr:SGNH/GDSL hydrolase family protein [Cohnella sp. LGH]QTH43743.1 GDSL family lipase [Cohnella sp. LGH]